MKRQKLYDRDEFSYEERQSVSAKSDDRCCHCGTLKYINYGATVDHFVPLHKGGSNQMINLVMLCEDCNQEKGSKIVPVSYLPYLKPKYQQELDGYLDSYIRSFEYIGRKQLFACDEYEVVLLNETAYVASKRKSYVKKMMKTSPLGTKYKIKIAKMDDFVRICDYYEKYLKKYGAFNSREAVEANIRFWMRFGCIYYMEKASEVSVMTVFTVRHVTDITRSFENLDYGLNMYVFSYYANEQAFSIASNIIQKFPQYIMEEQDIKLMPVFVNLLENDKLTGMLLAESGTKGSYINGGINNCVSVIMVMSAANELPADEKYEPTVVEGTITTETILSSNGGRITTEEQANEEIAKTIEFFKNFEDIDEKLIGYYKTHKNVACWIDWMLYDILSCEDVEKAGVFEDGEMLEHNKKEMRKLKACRMGTIVSAIRGAKSSMNIETSNEREEL